MRKGFTLIETLVVVAVIALLIAILIPVVGKVQDTARLTICIGNNEQLGRAMKNYGVEHDGRLMPVQKAGSGTTNAGGNWYRVLKQYISETGFAESNDEDFTKNVGLCPSSITKEDTGTAYYQPGDHYESWVWQEDGGSYGVNHWLQPDGDFYVDAARPSGYISFIEGHLDKFYTSFEDTRDPANTPTIGEARWVGGWPGENDQVKYNPPFIPHNHGYMMQRFAIDRHDRGLVAHAFADGSARTLDIGELWTKKWHAKWTRTTPADFPKE